MILSNTQPARYDAMSTDDVLRVVDVPLQPDDQYAWDASPGWQTRAWVPCTTYWSADQTNAPAFPSTS